MTRISRVCSKVAQERQFQLNWRSWWTLSTVRSLEIDGPLQRNVVQRKAQW